MSKEFKTYCLQRVDAESEEALRERLHRMLKANQERPLLKVNLTDEDIDAMKFSYTEPKPYYCAFVHIEHTKEYYEQQIKDAQKALKNLE